MYRCLDRFGWHQGTVSKCEHRCMHLQNIARVRLVSGVCPIFSEPSAYMSAPQLESSPSGGPSTLYSAGRVSAHG